LPDDDGLLREMLREAEGVLDQQLHALDELDDKTEQLLAVGVATAGAGIALFAFLAQRGGGVGLAAQAGWMASFASNLAALLAFLQAYVGFGARRLPKAGPSLSWLAEKANDAAWSLEAHVASVVAAYPEYFRNNDRVLVRQGRAQQIGLALLTASVLSYAGVAFYVLR
jgi:hypothetical protein